MRLLYITAGAFLLLFSIFSGSVVAAAGQQPQGGNSSINSTINATASYIQQVNQSAYLIFYPNLAQAYGYLQKAENISKTNTTGAYSLLSKARASAAQQESNLDSEKQDSLIVMVLLTIITTLLLYQVMKRRKPEKIPRARR
jgi:predicted PurR-regulated permease PerM